MLRCCVSTLRSTLCRETNLTNAAALGTQEIQHAWAWSLGVNILSWYMQVRPVSCLTVRFPSPPKLQPEYQPQLEPFAGTSSSPSAAKQPLIIRIITCI